MVTGGSTPHFDGFVVRCPGSRILLIDTGISRAYGGEQSALVIDYEFVPLERGPNVWRERQTLTALYRGRMPRVIDRSETDVVL